MAGKTNFLEGVDNVGSHFFARKLFYVGEVSKIYIYLIIKKKRK